MVPFIKYGASYIGGKRPISKFSIERTCTVIIKVFN